MQAQEIEEQKRLAQYEGLVRTTAARYTSMLAGKAMDFDDICQVLRIAVWRAVESFDERKATQELDGYVFMCIRNQAKDLVKRRTPESMARDPLHIEDIAPTHAESQDTRAQNNGLRDAFEMRYQSINGEVFDAVIEEPLRLPNTLSRNERHVLGLLYDGYRQAEIGPILGLTPSQVKTSVKAIREKMADWCPTIARDTASSAA